MYIKHTDVEVVCVVRYIYHISLITDLLLMCITRAKKNETIKEKWIKLAFWFISLKLTFELKGEPKWPFVKQPKVEKERRGSETDSAAYIIIKIRFIWNIHLKFSSSRCYDLTWLKIITETNKHPLMFYVLVFFPLTWPTKGWTLVVMVSVEELQPKPPMY